MSGFFEDLGGLVMDGIYGVEDVVSTIYTDAKSGVSSVYHSFDEDTKLALNTVKDNGGKALDDIHDAIDKGGDVANNFIDKGGKVADDVVKQTGKTVRSVGNNVADIADDVPKALDGLSLPLMAAAGVAAIYLLTKK